MSALGSWFANRNIWFNCPACTRKLVVGAEAGGFRAECPHCRRTIPIPTRSTAWPTWMKDVLLYTSHVVLLAGGIGAGWWFAASGRTNQPEATPATPPIVHAEAPAQPVVTPVAETPPADAVSMDLLDEHVALKGRYDKMVQWMIDNYRGKYPLPEHLVQRLRITPINETMEVSPELVELLRMSEEEKVKVQDMFDFVRDNITEAELDRALITEQDEDKITLSIPPYAEVGGTLRDDLYLTLEDTLGGPRFDRLVDVTGPELEQTFHYFGQAARTLTFEVIYPQSGESFEPYVLIRDGWVIPEGDSVRLTKVSETAVTKIPETYKPYQDHMPDNVIRYATP